MALCHAHCQYRDNMSVIAHSLIVIIVSILPAMCDAVCCDAVCCDTVHCDVLCPVSSLATSYQSLCLSVFSILYGVIR